jgi:hypothetical protein
MTVHQIDLAAAMSTIEELLKSPSEQFSASSDAVNKFLRAVVKVKDVRYVAASGGGRWVDVWVCLNHENPDLSRRIHGVEAKHAPRESAWPIDVHVISLDRVPLANLPRPTKILYGL